MSEPIQPANTAVPRGGADGFPEDVCIAVVAHNAIETIASCMDGIDASGCPKDRVTVYDVASGDGTGRWLNEHYPAVRVVRLTDNQGPNPARNLAINECVTPFVLVMDSDVELLPDTARVLRQAMSRGGRVGIVTPVVLYADRPGVVQYRRSWVHYLAEASADVDDLSVGDLDAGVKRVGLASGCAPLIRKDAAIASGLFEERYFLGKDDGEFAFRMTIAGYDILEPAGARVLHHHSKRGGAFFRHQLTNRWHFILKDFQLRTLIAVSPILLVYEPALLLLMLLIGHGVDYFHGLFAFIQQASSLPGDRAGVAGLRRRHDWQVLRGDRLVVPESISGRAGFKQLACAYSVLLGAYWSVARRLLSWISRPIDGEAMCVVDAQPSSKDVAASGSDAQYNAV